MPLLMGMVPMGTMFLILLFKICTKGLIITLKINRKDTVAIIVLRTLIKKVKIL